MSCNTNGLHNTQIVDGAEVFAVYKQKCLDLGNSLHIAVSFSGNTVLAAKLMQIGQSSASDSDKEKKKRK